MFVFFKNKVNKKCSVGVTAVWSGATGAAAARVWGTAAAAEPRGAWASFLWDQRDKHKGYWNQQTLYLHTKKQKTKVKLSLVIDQGNTLQQG